MKRHYHERMPLAGRISHEEREQLLLLRTRLQMREDMERYHAPNLGAGEWSTYYGTEDIGDIEAAYYG